MSIDFSAPILRYDSKAAAEDLFKIVDSKGELVEASAQELTLEQARDRLLRLGQGYQALKTGERKQKLGPFIAPYLATGKVPRERTALAQAIAFRIHRGDAGVELAADDVSMVLSVIDEDASVWPWAKAAIRYLLDRGSLPESVRSIYDGLYGRGNGHGAVPSTSGRKRK